MARPSASRTDSKSLTARLAAWFVVAPLLASAGGGVTAAIAVALSPSPATAQTATARNAAAQADQSPANRLFVQAIQAIQQADGTLDQAEESRFLKEADLLLTEIISKYPDSALAVQLMTNQFVGDFDYFDFRGRIRSLVCNEPLASACFLHRVTEILPPVETPITTARWDWLSLAIAYNTIGDTGRAKEIVAPFVSAVRRGIQSETAGQDLFVARALALMGQTQLALDITRRFNDCSTRLYNLSDIGKAAAWRGDLAQTAQLAEEAAAFASANDCKWELGLVAQSLHRAGREGQARTLFLNSVETQFSRFGEKQANCCPPELVVAAAELGDPPLALNLLRSVQEENPWTIPAVLGRIARRSDLGPLVNYAEQLSDADNRGEAYAELLEASQRKKDATTSHELMRRITALVAEAAGKRPALLVQQAKAERALYGDERWRPTFQSALNAAERSSNFVRRDIGAPLLAALVRIETGLPMLD